MAPLILLDMDGVITDFLSAAVAAHGRDYQELLKSWPEGEWHVDKVMGVPASDFFAVLERDENFWAELKPYPWADRLYDGLKALAPVLVCTTPTYDPNCLHGKLRWLQKWKGRGFRDFVMTPRKEALACACKDVVLVDDSDENCRKFRDAGGKAVVFPAHTNSRHYAKNIAADMALSDVRRLLGKD